jgi:hypothetical protein
MAGRQAGQHPVQGRSNQVRSGNDKQRGLYRKFHVTRTDGSSKPGGKHEHCRYFVLDLDHDQYAAAALKAYEEACCAEFPRLAIDLMKIRHEIEARLDRETVERLRAEAGKEQKS